MVAALGILLGLLATWPLLLHLGTRVPASTGDPMLQAWEVAWGGHALIHQPLRFFQANIFWPLGDSLAFSDALVGYAPAGLIGSGHADAITRYDLLFIAAIALVFVATYLFARELGAGRFGALVGGLAYAYAPWRLGHADHLNVLSVGGIPLALFLLLRGYRRGSRWQIVAGWLVASWQVSLGFAIGLQFLYVLLAIAIVVVVAWQRSGRPSPPRVATWPTVFGIAVLVITSVVLARPYMRVLHDHPEARRSYSTVARYSPPVGSFASASPDRRKASARKSSSVNCVHSPLGPGSTSSRWHRATSSGVSDIRRMENASPS